MVSYGSGEWIKFVRGRVKFCQGIIGKDKMIRLMMMVVGQVTVNAVVKIIVGQVEKITGSNCSLADQEHVIYICYW